MPELPEVETICGALQIALRGRIIKAVDVRHTGLRVPFPPKLAGKLKNRRILSCARRAKYICVNLDNGQTLLIHLGMAGRILLHHGGPYRPGKHDHLIVTCGDGTRMIMNDARRFGMVLLLADGEQNTHKALRGLGPEPLERSFNGPALAARLKGRKTCIKAALLDQRLIAGIGNIYASEALFRAGTDPRRRAGSLTAAEATRLAASIKTVLRAAIKAGGSTLKDYRTAEGELGYFQHHFAVYDREGRACPGCRCQVSRTGGIKRIVQGGRSTFFCPRKQT